MRSITVIGRGGLISIDKLAEFLILAIGLLPGPITVY